MVGIPQQLRGFRVYCDESNTDGRKPHPVYGAILVALDDIQEVQHELAEWRRQEAMHGELKWEKVRGGLRLRKYKSLVDLLFKLSRQRELLHFKAIILDRRAPEYLAYSKGDDELGFYKFYYHWLLRYFAKFPVRHRCHLRVIIDERGLPAGKPDPYATLKIILNHGIRQEFQMATDVVTKVEPLDSKQSDLLQAADVLMGAIGYHNQGFHLRPNADKDKVELARYLAARLGLRDLKHETNPTKEYLKIVRWHWSGPKPRYRRRAADNPRHGSRRLGLRTDRCRRCRDRRWVCEEHPDQPLGHDGCDGAGMPCPGCNAEEPPERPAGWVSIASVDADD